MKNAFSVLIVGMLAAIAVVQDAAGQGYEFVNMWPELPQPWYFNGPSGVAVDGAGNVYVADSENHRIQKFTSGGTFITKWGSYGSGDGEFNRPGGVLADGSGNVYVADTDNHRIQKFTSAGQFITKWGSQGSEDGEFKWPSGITVDGSGNVYVADMYNDRIQKFTSGGTFIAKWGSSGSGDGELAWPSDVAVDASGNVYVADMYNDRIQKFTSAGAFIAKWGSQGNGNGEFWHPYGVAVDGLGDVYVADSGNNRVQKFTSGGTFIVKWGSYGSGDGQFMQVPDVAVDASGNVYVADRDNARVQKFTSGGTFITKWGSSGSGDGEFNRPWGVLADGSGNVYVADTDNDRIQKFTSSGVFITKWGTEGSSDGEFEYPCGAAVDGSGNVYVADRDNDRVQKFTSSGAFITKWGSSGNGDGEFNHPFGMAVDGSGNVYVADRWAHRIQKFTSAGVFLTKWGSWGDADGEFSWPYGVAVDASGNVYVADMANNRIQKFTSSGVFLTKWGSQGSADGEFYLPSGVAVDGSGNVYVADPGNNRIQKFTPAGQFITKWGSYGSGDGEFYGPYGVAVDASGNVYVADTYNDRIQKFRPTSAPDLVVTSLTMDTNPIVQPESTTIRWTIKNQGNADATPVNYWFRIVLSDDPTYDEGSPYVAGKQISINLDPQEEYSSTFNFNSGNYTTGDFCLVAKVDTTDIVSESNENNNTRSLPITIEPFHGHRVSGYVLYANLNGFGGVTVRLTGNGEDLADTTQNDGYYHFEGLANGTYTVAAEKPGWVFDNSPQAAIVSGADVSLADMIGHQETITKPGTPTGETNPEVGTTYPYTTSGAASSLGHTVEYQFDWDDGTTSAWSTSTSASHAWSSTGPRTVTVTARCQIHNSILNVSDGLTVTVVSGEAISKPGTPTGETNPEAGTTYPYTTSGATSNLGHTVEYQFDWGDGATSAWSTSTSASHAWSSTGPRTITVAARCQVHTDRMNVSDPLPVTVVEPGTLPVQVVTVEATPSEIPNDGTVRALITAAVSDGDGLGDIAEAWVDLSSVGGDATQPMNDLGQAGDGAAGDGVFSYSLSVSDPSVLGVKELPVVVRDSGGYQATGAATVTVIDGPSFGGVYEKTVGMLTVKCDAGFESVGADRWRATGLISINDFLMLNGEINLDQTSGNLIVSGSGKLYVEDVYLIGTVVLYEGEEFSFDPASGLTTALNALSSKLDLGGLHVEIRSLQITPGLDGVIVSGSLRLPDALGGAMVDVGELTCSQSAGITFETLDFYLDSLDIPGTDWGLSDVHISIDLPNDTYGGEGWLTTPIVTIWGSLEIHHGALNQIGVALRDFSPIPIGATGLSLTALSGAVDHLADPEPVIVYAGATVSLALTESHRVVDFIGDIEIGQAGYIKGTLLVRYLILDEFDGFDLGQLTVILGAEGTRWEGLSAEGWVNIQDMFYGEGELYIGLDRTLQGQGVGTFALPAWLGGGSVDATVQFDNSRVRTVIPINWLTIQNVGVQFDNVWPNAHFLVNADVEDWAMMMAPPPGLMWMAGPAAQVFDLPAGREQAIFRVRWSEGDADIVVHRPSGGLIEPAASPEHGADYDYFKDPDALQAVVIVADPEAGAWTVEVPETTGIGLYWIELLGLNGAPAIEVTEPSMALGPQPSYNIIWSASDPDDDALVSLFYDIDNVGANGVLIWSGISETETSYLWSPTDVPTGTYSIYALIDDGKNSPVASYSTGTVEIVNPSDPPEAPGNLTFIESHNSVWLEWDAPSVGDIAGYRTLYSTDLGGTEFESYQDTGDSTDHLLTGLLNNTSYRIAVVAYDADGRESPVSASVEATPHVIEGNVVPTITSTALTAAIERQPYVYEVEASDPEGHPIRYGLAQGPEGMTIDIRTGRIAWVPTHFQVGDYTVQVIARDLTTEFGSQTFDITVDGDMDYDGIGDSDDPDRDGDGIDNGSDPMPDDSDNDGTDNADDPDDDNDGLFDVDELLIGTNPLDPDTDGDGMDDGDEIKYGLDPLDPDSLVAILSIVPDGTNPGWLKITWPVVASKTYTIYWSDDFVSWDAVGEPAVGDIVNNGDGTWTWTDKGTDPEMGGVTPGDAATRFYRIGVDDAPPVPQSTDTDWPKGKRVPERPRVEPRRRRPQPQ